MNKKILCLLILNCLLTMFNYMIYPFLSIHMIRNLGMTLTQTGVIVGIMSLSSSVVSVFCGGLIKKLNAKMSLVLGLVMIAVVQILFLYTPNFIITICFAFVYGLAGALANPSLKILLSINKTDMPAEKVFRFRYTSLCIGITVGPIIGACLFGLSVTFLFYFVSALYVCSSCILVPAFKVFGILEREEDNVFGGERKTEEMTSTNEKFALRRFVSAFDIRLLFVCSVSTLVFIVFAVFESVTPLVLVHDFDKPEQIFSLLIVLNSVLAMLLQPVILKITSKFRSTAIGTIGCIIFAIAYILFALSQNHLVFLIIAMTVFTIGEALTIPSLDVVLDDIAPTDKKTLYFTIGEIKNVGFFLSPTVGSVIISNFSNSAMFYAVAIISILCFALYAILGKLCVKWKKCNV